MEVVVLVYNKTLQHDVILEQQLLLYGTRLCE